MATSSRTGFKPLSGRPKTDNALIKMSDKNLRKPVTDRNLSTDTDNEVFTTKGQIKDEMRLLAAPTSREILSRIWYVLKCQKAIHIRSRFKSNFRHIL